MLQMSEETYQLIKISDMNKYFHPETKFRIRGTLPQPVEKNQLFPNITELRDMGTQTNDSPHNGITGINDDQPSTSEINVMRDSYQCQSNTPIPTAIVQNDYVRNLGPAPRPIFGFHFLGSPSTNPVFQNRLSIPVTFKKK